MGMYMNVDGVPGECEVDGYKEWIELTYGSYNMSIPYDPAATAYKTGTVEMTDYHGAAVSRAHMPTLINKQTKGGYFPKVIIHETVSDDGEKPVRILTLEHCTFVNFDLSMGTGVGGGSFTLTFAKITDETLIIPTAGASPVSKGSVIYDKKQKKVLS